jgi:hypothetical protein
MAMRILTRLPFSEAHFEVRTPDGIFDVKPYQIVVMVSITARNIAELDPGAPRIPAILDTGHNHNFAIRREQLDLWVKLSEPERGQIRVGGVPVALVPAIVWIHTNRPGTRESANRPPFKLELREGIAVYPPEMRNPARLPTLGLRGIVRNGLKLVIDGLRRDVTLKTSGWF